MTFTVTQTAPLILLLRRSLYGQDKKDQLRAILERQTAWLGEQAAQEVYRNVEQETSLLAVLSGLLRVREWEDEDAVGRAHGLASEILSWAEGVDPEVPLLKMWVKEEEAQSYERLLQRACEARAARLRQQTADLRGIAEGVERDRLRAAEEHQQQIERGLQQLEGTLATTEQLLQAGVVDQRAYAARLGARLAEGQAASVSCESQIRDLQRRLQCLR